MDFQIRCEEALVDLGSERGWRAQDIMAQNVAHLGYY